MLRADTGKSAGQPARGVQPPERPCAELHRARGLRSQRQSARDRFERQGRLPEGSFITHVRRVAVAVAAATLVVNVGVEIRALPSIADRRRSRTDCARRAGIRSNIRLGGRGPCCLAVPYVVNYMCICVGVFYRVLYYRYLYYSHHRYLYYRSSYLQRSSFSLFPSQAGRSAGLPVRQSSALPGIIIIIITTKP